MNEIDLAAVLRAAERFMENERVEDGAFADQPWTPHDFEKDVTGAADYLALAANTAPVMARALRKVLALLNEGGVPIVVLTDVHTALSEIRDGEDES